MRAGGTRLRTEEVEFNKEGRKENAGEVLELDSQSEKSRGLTPDTSNSNSLLEAFRNPHHKLTHKQPVVSD